MVLAHMDRPTSCDNRLWLFCGEVKNLLIDMFWVCYCILMYLYFIQIQKAHMAGVQTIIWLNDLLSWPVWRGLRGSDEEAVGKEGQ
jgi:hypothetical protein